MDLHTEISAQVHLWPEHVEIPVSDGKRTVLRLGDQHHVCTYRAGSILSSERSRDLTVTASITSRRKEPVSHWQEKGLPSCPCLTRIGLALPIKRGFQQGENLLHQGIFSLSRSMSTSGDQHLGQIAVRSTQETDH